MNLNKSNPKAEAAKMDPLDVEVSELGLILYLEPAKSYLIALFTLFDNESNASSR